MNFSIANWNFCTHVHEFLLFEISITWFVKEERQFKMEFEYRSRVCPGSPRCLFTGSEADAFIHTGTRRFLFTRESHAMLLLGLLVSAAALRPTLHFAHRSVSAPRCPSSVVSLSGEHEPAKALVHEPSQHELTVLDASAIVAGSVVGGGFLAVPLFTAPIGVLPSATVFAATWGFLVLCGLAYTEAAAAVLANDETGETGERASVLSVSRRYLGTPLATVLAVVFFLQMLIIATANLVKAAELIGVVFPALPHGRSIVLLATIFGVFNLVATSRVMASVNTALTGTMCAGFLAFFVAVAAKSAPPASAVLAHPQWRLLLPQAGWAVPLFVNTLRFGEAVPVVVGQFGPRRLSKARLAVIVGSLVPMLLAVGLSVAGRALSLAGMNRAIDPLIAFLQTPGLGAPIVLVSAGAIGSTLLGVLLATSQLLRDSFRLSSPRVLLGARAVVPIVIASLACRSTGLYLRLLAFAGAFPCSRQSSRSRHAARRAGWRAASRRCPVAGGRCGCSCCSRAACLA